MKKTFLIFQFLFMTCPSFGQGFNITRFPYLINSSCWGTSLIQLESNKYLISSASVKYVVGSGNIDIFNYIIDDMGTTVDTFSILDADTGSFQNLPGYVLLKNDSLYYSMSVYRDGGNNARQQLYRFHKNNYQNPTLLKSILGPNLPYLDTKNIYDYGGGFISCGIYKTSFAKLGILNTDYDGNIKWLKTFPASQNKQSFGFGNVGTSDKGFVISAQVNFYEDGVWDSLNTGDTRIYKLDSAGNVKWHKDLWKNSKSYFLQLRKYTDNIFYLSGSIDSSFEADDHPKQNFVLSKFDSLGNLEWMKPYNTAGPYGMQGIWQMKLLANNGILAMGSMVGINGPYVYNEDLAWAELRDTAGNTIWKNTFKPHDSATFAYLSDALLMDNGDYLFVGCGSDSIKGGQALWILRTDACGNTLVNNCRPFAVTELMDEQKIKVFPNPTNSYFQIKGLSEPANIKLYNAVGTLLTQELIQPNEKIMVAHLPKSFYFVEVLQENKIIYNGKVLLY